MLEDRDDVMMQRIQQIPAIKSVAGVTVPVSGARTAADLSEEPEAERQARMEARQWKELKVDYSELPDIYARLSKIKLTGQAPDSAADCWFRVKGTFLCALFVYRT